MDTEDNIIGNVLRGKILNEQLKPWDWYKLGTIRINTVETCTYKSSFSKNLQPKIIYFDFNYLEPVRFDILTKFLATASFYPFHVCSTNHYIYCCDR